MNKRLITLKETTNLLDEYSSVCIEMEKIKSRIFDLRDNTKKKIMSAKTQKEKQDIFSQFKEEVLNIKSDKSISERYIMLKLERNQLKKKITKNMIQGNISDSNSKKHSDAISNGMENDLLYLLKKYDKDESKKIETSVNESIMESIIIPPKPLTLKSIHYSEQHNELNKLIKNIKIDN